MMSRMRIRIKICEQIMATICLYFFFRSLFGSGCWCWDRIWRLPTSFATTTAASDSGTSNYQYFLLVFLVDGPNILVTDPSLFKTWLHFHVGNCKKFKEITICFRKNYFRKNCTKQWRIKKVMNLKKMFFPSFDSFPPF